MNNLISTIFSNPVYLAIAGVVLLIVVILVIKKLFKVLIYVCLFFALFLAYVKYTGGDVKKTLEDVKNKSMNRDEFVR